MDTLDLAASPLAVASIVLLAAATRYMLRYLRPRMADLRDRLGAPAVETGPVVPCAVLTDAAQDHPSPRDFGADRHARGAWPQAEPAHGEQRGQKRFKTCFLGTLHRSAGTEANNLCDIVDLSASGARVRPVDPLPATERIALGLRHFGVLPARVVWRRGDEVGLKFDSDPMETMTVMRGLLPSGPASH